MAEPSADPPLTLVSSGDDGVTVLTLNRPGKKNALSIALREEVVARLRALAADDTVQAGKQTTPGHGLEDPSPVTSAVAREVQSLELRCRS